MKRGDGDRTRILQRAGERLLRRRGAAPGRAAGTLPWEAEFFGLPAVAQYRAAAPERRRAVLAQCADAVLAESWFIEQGGVLFCARMTLACESDGERRLYALIGGDEAMHSAWLEPWVCGRARQPDAFNRFIAGLVEAGGVQPLAYLLQVVLEGFGIAHYTRLAAACRDTALGALLRRMAQDEAAHHAGGLAAFAPSRLTAAERRFVAEGAYGFLQMIRGGPQAVMAALDRSIGIDGAGPLAAAFAELDAEAAGAAKLAHLRRLMQQPGMEWLLEELDEKGAFTPCSAAQCAALYASAR